MTSLITSQRTLRSTWLIGLVLIAPVLAPATRAEADEPKAEKATRVEHVLGKPRFQREGLGTKPYQPSDAENPYFDRLNQDERVTGGLAGDYRLLGKHGKYVGWFGIVRKVETDANTGQSKLVVEHKYFDGLTDLHIQAISFNGGGDFVATLQGPGVERQIRPLTLVKVYGVVAQSDDQATPTVKAEFIRNWHWGTFTFIGAHGKQRGSEEWRKLNQVPLDDIYEPYPRDGYYEERLGRRPDEARRKELFHRLAEQARQELSVNEESRKDAAGPRPKILSSEDADTFRTRAENACRKAGVELTAPVRELMEAIEKRDFKATSLALRAAFEQKSHQAVALVLGETLLHPDNEVRMFAAENLETLGFSGRQVVPQLTSTLNDEDPYVRNYAATALGNIRSEARSAIPSLIIALADKDSFVRSSSCDALGQINRQASCVVPALVEALNDDDSSVRWEAVGALGSFGERGAAATDALRETLLNDKDSNVRWRAAASLASVDPNGRIAILALMAALGDENPSVRRFAASALGQFGPKSNPAVGKLTEALGDRDVGARVAAAGALWKVSGNTKDTLPILTEVLIAKNGGPQRMWAATEVGQMGPDAIEAVDALRVMVKSTPNTWKSYGVLALGKIGPGAAPALPELVELFESDQPSTRAEAAEAIWKIDQRPEALQALIALLKQPDDYAIFSVVRALGEIGVPARDAVPDLINMLSNESWYVREATLVALNKIDPQWESAGQTP